ncbi:endogenous retrovirus group K member 11 Pol [Pelobates cultripes]|uniref:Endogenous retrovirus group K member 11 Pol n=1 Tax=Pelobates cultripes TaxID=61616 RepID=A0AAD1SDU8_PELCU|nr:endogenous retrovirus group K member 11 Pol [Pelobates cultripes]
MIYRCAVLIGKPAHKKLKKVDYLGFVLQQGTRSLSSKRIEALQKIPKPVTKKELLTFLGIINYCRQWIPECLHYDSILRMAVKGDSPDYIRWSPEMVDAYVALKIKYGPINSGTMSVLHAILTHDNPNLSKTQPEEHDCIHAIHTHISPHLDLMHTAQPGSEDVFVDGSCSRPVDGQYQTGYAVVQLPGKKDARTVVKILTTEIIPQYGCPLQINSDNGPAFASKITPELAKWLQEPSHPYQPSDLVCI